MNEKLQIDVAILDFSKSFDKLLTQGCYTNWNIMG